MLNKVPRDIRPLDMFLMDFYIDSLDHKINYEIRKEKSITLQQAFKIALSLENIRKATSKGLKGDDPKLCIPKASKKNKEEDKINKKK